MFNFCFSQIIEAVKDIFPYSFSFLHRNGQIPVDLEEPDNVCGCNISNHLFSKVQLNCLIKNRNSCTTACTGRWVVYKIVVLNQLSLIELNFPTGVPFFIWVRVIEKKTCKIWAFFKRRDAFASHRYGLGSTLTLGHMWDIFHPSQPMPGGFPLGVFFHPQKGSNLFLLEQSHKANWPGQNLFWVT